MDMKYESKLRKRAQNISMDSCNPDDIQKHGAALHACPLFK